MSGRDFLTIGMLYAAGTGVMVGTSIAHGGHPALGWALGAAVLVAGGAYDCRERKRTGGTDQ